MKFDLTVVTKPSWAAQSKQPILNETTICDFLLDSCDNSTVSTAAELTSDYNRTGNSKHNIFLKMTVKISFF